MHIDNVYGNSVNTIFSQNSKSIQLDHKAEELFKQLGAKTNYKIKSLDPCNVVSRFKGVECPYPSIAYKGVYLHGNLVSLNNPSSPENLPLVNFIATQAPYKYISGKLVKNSYGTFWGVVKENSDLIIDLTQSCERDFSYYPKEKKEILYFGDISVRHKSTVQLTDQIFYHTYKIKDSNRNSKLVSRIDYRGWKNQTGFNIESLMKIFDIVSFIRPNSNLPIVVHSLAGVGRTGSFIVAAALKEMYKSGSLCQDKQEAVIGNLILQARDQSGPYTVNSSSQIKGLLEFAERLILGQLDNAKLQNWLSKEKIYTIDPCITDSRSHDDLYNRKRFINIPHQQTNQDRTTPTWHSDIGLSVVEFQEMQFEYNKRLADAGSPKAKLEISNCYFQGYGTPTNIEEGIKYRNMVADTQFVCETIDNTTATMANRISSAEYKRRGETLIQRYTTKNQYVSINKKMKLDHNVGNIEKK